MKLGAETNTRWLWFITYILLPVNAIAQIFALFWLLDANLAGIGIIFTLAELGLAIATIIGLHQFKTWGWYCIMAVFGIQLIGAPLKVHVKASLRYEITQAANSYLQSQGRSPFTTTKPSIFDFEPMLTFFLLLAIWTIPNAIYMFRRRSLYTISTSSNYGMSGGLENPSPIGISAPMNNVVTSMEEQAFANAKQEYESGNIRDGLMVKVITEEPDPEKQRLLYIRYRAQQLCTEQQQLEFTENTNARNVTIKFWVTQIAKQLFIAILLFFIPVFSSVGFFLGVGPGSMLFGLVLWVLYAFLLLWSGSSRAWLAIPAVCVIFHLFSPITSNFSFPLSILAAYIALPFFITAVVRIARSRRTVASASMGAKDHKNGQE